MRLKSIILELVFTVVLAMIVLPAVPVKALDIINGHNVVLDGSGKIIPWTPDPTQGYDQVMKLSWNYLLNSVPSDSQNGKPAYYSHSYMNPDTQEPVDWPHNPAGLYAMLIESALKYYGYSGNVSPVRLAENVATAMIRNGMTPNGGNWVKVPYASGDAGSLTYRGATYGDFSNGAGDGAGVIEPDKVGEMGDAWLQLYRFNGNTAFRDAAIAAADALASHVRRGNSSQSPWPFRVYAKTGGVREDYCANVIGPIKLFDGLISLGLGNAGAYQTARQIAWNWLMTYPIQNNIWSNYFEDVPIQPNTNNFNQYSAMMTARYLLEYSELDADWERHVRDLISWVERNFAISAYGANTIREQRVFWFPMGSHTSRYASVNALLYEKTGDEIAKEKAYRALNWATYMARPNGEVIDGPEVNNQWFTDGYGDYIRHFMTSLGAVPAWAPDGLNHLVRSSSIVINVNYSASGINYTTSDGASRETLRTNFTPASVIADGLALSQRADLTQVGWTFDPVLSVLQIRHDVGTKLQIISVQAALAITTTTLPGGTQHMVYSASLAGTGGILPYTWSIASGALPAGLSLTSGTGVISGTPTATGTFSFTARVTAANGQSVTTPLLSIGISTLVTLWPGTVVPGLVDAGADSPVELGVKLRSDVNGSITGIRFYKASTNTGTHVANLWTSAGTKLATATFTGETASGWQQVLFSSSVPITANTVYVASYHALTGHYSANLNYFATGVDSPPLHALANGISGGNGVYAYGSTSLFPAQTYNAANYWVDVAFSPDPPPARWSIAVTPATPTISTGTTQSFTATGTYSNGSTQNLTSQVAWSSSSTSVATINSTGLATAANPGSTTISATLGTVAAGTNLTVQATPLTITTTSLPVGNLNVAYTATLAASGALTPYTWSIVSGALPTGLSLTSGTGVISGTPAATGAFSFTARVTAANGQSVTNPLSISIVTLVTIWPDTLVPSLVDAGADSPVELGVKFRSDVNGSITGIRFYKASTNTGTHVANLWTSSGTLLTTATFAGETASGWQQVLFSSPVPITANTVYVASYHALTGHYSANLNYFATGMDSPPLHAPASGVSGGNGVYAYGSTSLFPAQTYSSANYWVDVMFQP